MFIRLFYTEVIFMEELSLFSLSNLKSMEVIDINTGAKIGYDTYSVVSVIIPTQKISWFTKNNDIEVPWNNIHKIGVDVILVKDIEFSSRNEE